MFRQLGFAARGCAEVARRSPLTRFPATSPRAGRRRDCDGQTVDPSGWRVASDCANADTWQPSCGDRVCGHLHHVRDVRLQLGGSLRRWRVFMGYLYTPSATGSVDRRSASSQRRVRQQDAYRVFQRPASAGGGHSATARAHTQSAACACGVGSITSVDATGCASGAGPAAAGAAAGRERMG
jgi:hypothetical protein